MDIARRPAAKTFRDLLVWQKRLRLEYTNSPLPFPNTKPMVYAVKCDERQSPFPPISRRVFASEVNLIRHNS